MGRGLADAFTRLVLNYALKTTQSALMPTDPHFQKVKEHVTELEYYISYEDPEEGVLVIEDEENGIRNLVMDCEDPIVIFEMFLVEIQQPTSNEALIRLLQKNREIIHGALALDDSGKRLLFRDTLQLENLDANEVEGTLNSLALMMTESYDQLLQLAGESASGTQQPS